MQVFDPKNNEIKQKKKKFYFNAQKHYIDCQKDIVGKVKTTKKKIKWIKKPIKGKKGTKGRTNKVKILREIKKKRILSRYCHSNCHIYGSNDKL